MSYRSGFAVLAGRPNVGKSTLLNALLGAKVAIVSAKPQTTRNRIAGVLHRPEGQVVFLDTPGLHRPQSRLGEYMERVAEGALEGVELVLHVVAADREPGAAERKAAERIGRAEAPLHLVLNKMDLVDRATLEAREEAYRALGSYARTWRVSALTGEGLAELRQGVLEAMPEGPAYFPEGTLTDQPEERVMAELIREQVFELTREEIPYATAVTVERVEPRPQGRLYVGATIWVERESQKGILIGQGGRMLREIGRRARQEIEALFGNPLYLDLYVKVKEDWRDHPGRLRSLGYADDR
ncbi:MAG: GTPase Era [Clostridia bacterium]|nr:GTPase Era [Clostridia bacterium]MCL6522177.1 GTPase Era [Bacillota bacterium]